MSKKVQTAITNVRITRDPLDSEAVMNTYSDLSLRIKKVGNAETEKGSFYAGLYTAVVDDPDKSKNAPYFISYIKTGSGGTSQISYEATRIMTEKDMQTLVFSWGHLE